MGRFSRVVLALLLFAFLVVGQASAHARLDSAAPQPGATIDVPPAEVRIWTSQELMLSGNALAVFDVAGNQVDNRDAHVDQSDRDRRQLVATLPPVSDGTYTVRFTTTSAEDGHVFDDSFEFTLVAAPVDVAAADPEATM